MKEGVCYTRSVKYWEVYDLNNGEDSQNKRTIKMNFPKRSTSRGISRLNNSRIEVTLENFDQKEMLD